MSPEARSLPPILIAWLALSHGPAAASPEFVGSESCRNCHAAEFTAWQGSHHDLAMQEASTATVLGDFDNAEITAQGVTTRFFRRGEEFVVRSDGPDGSLQDYVIAYTFGVAPLQQYLIAFPDGRLQALGLAWDARPAGQGGQRWFHLYPNEAVPHTDPLHWTGPEQNWNYQCADCHVTGYRKNFDPQSGTFESKWAAIDVGCEACHGPGSAHLTWAEADRNLGTSDVSRGLSILLHDRRGVSWNMDPATGTARRSEPKSQEAESEVCAGCHSRRGTIRAGKDGAGAFLDYHLPAFLTEPLYHPDGQIREEVYDWGSFLQSRMHAAGVTCSDCHDPHSGTLRAPGSEICGQCHLPARFATRDHHGHAAGSAGADCLACHMPETTYMVIDPRRDHSLRVPRPDLLAELGTPDACSQCHQDRGAEWAADVFKQLFPNAGEPFQSWGRAFHLARNGLPQAEVALLAVANRPGTPDLARATAILELHNFLSPLSAEALKQALADPSPLVRIAGLRTLEALPVENRWKVAEPLLADPLLAVRAEAGRVLAATPREYLEPGQQRALDGAVQAYIATQDYNAERPESRVNLGNLYLRTGQPERAEPFYHAAIRRDRRFTPAYVYLAELYRNQGLEADARAMIESGLKQQPGAADLHHALGLMLVRSGDPAAALAELARAHELDPDNARYAYVYAIALNSSGRTVQALQVLESAQETRPGDRDLLFALSTIHRDAGNREAALKWAERMLELNPADRDAAQLKLELSGQY